MATVSVRYIVDAVDTALASCREHLGFEEQMHPAPSFAMLTRGDLRLVAPGCSCHHQCTPRFGGLGRHPETVPRGAG